MVCVGGVAHLKVCKKIENLGEKNSKSGKNW